MLHLVAGIYVYVFDGQWFKCRSAKSLFRHVRIPDRVGDDVWLVLVTLDPRSSRG